MAVNISTVIDTTDLDGTATTSDKLRLKTTAVTPGSYTNANVTVDSKGRITAASNGSGGSGITSLTGDVTASGSGSVAATIANNAVTTAKINDAAVTNAKVATGIDAAKLADGSVSNTEFQYLNGVTSAIQTQLDGKQAATATVTAKTADFTADGASGTIYTNTSAAGIIAATLQDSPVGTQYTFVNSKGNGDYIKVVPASGNTIGFVEIFGQSDVVVPGDGVWANVEGNYGSFTIAKVTSTLWVVLSQNGNVAANS